jgi:hypothetical protein
MSRFRFELATEADDADLREVLRRTPMGGNVSVTFRREPSYFRASPVDGPFRQVVVCRDTETGRIIGFGLRAVRQVYVNGEPQSIGYLGSLRVLEEYRNQGLVARGYRYFRHLHEDGRTPLYLTTIAEGNEKAIEVLTAGRAGLPRYHFAGLYHTAVLKPSRRYHRPEGVTVIVADGQDIPEVIAFLQREGNRRQFFPSYREEDFSQQGSLLDLKPEDVLLARRGGQLIGTLAAWNQSDFKQSIITGYRGWLRWFRRLLGLPPPGSELRYRTAALAVVREEDPAVFTALVQMHRRLLGFKGVKSLLVGLHERDPLLSAIRALRPRFYTTRLYLVCWDDGEAFRQSLDDRVPYLELGCL